MINLKRILSRAQIREKKNVELKNFENRSYPVFADKSSGLFRRTTRLHPQLKKSTGHSGCYSRFDFATFPFMPLVSNEFSERGFLGRQTPSGLHDLLPDTSSRHHPRPAVTRRSQHFRHCRGFAIRD